MPRLPLPKLGLKSSTLDVRKTRLLWPGWGFLSRGFGRQKGRVTGHHNKLVRITWNKGMAARWASQGSHNKVVIARWS